MAVVSGGTGKAGSARGAGAGAGRKVKQGTGTQEGAKRKEGSRGKAKSGAVRLKEAVDRELKTKSRRLAELLVEKALTDLPSLRLAVSLAEEREAPEEDHGPLRSQAAAFAAEPPWEEPAESTDPPMWVDPKGKGFTGEEGKQGKLPGSIAS